MITVKALVEVHEQTTIMLSFIFHQCDDKLMISLKITVLLSNSNT